MTSQKCPSSLSNNRANGRESKTQGMTKRLQLTDIKPNVPQYQIMCSPNSIGMVPQRLTGGNGTKNNFYNPAKIDNRDLEGVIEGPLLLIQKTVPKKP